MRISEKGLNLIKQFEGCELNAYKCPSGVWTLGWGHTENVTPNQSITQEEADNLLINDMVKYENYVNNCGDLTFIPNQNQFDALVSFTYNCGQGSLSTLVQNRDANIVADKLLLYVNGSNGVLQGLVRRREAERQLFLNGDFAPSPIVEQVEEIKSPIQKAKEFVGSRCLELQQKLNQAFRCGLAEDNDFGQLTYEALGISQLRLGVTCDFMAGDKTFSALDNYINSKKVVVTTPQSDTWVADLQNECNRQGYSNQAVDNIAGEITLASVPTLKKGSKGGITKLLQIRLNSLGFDCGEADGNFGEKTARALGSMQDYYGIGSDQICGKLSWSKLLGL